MMPDKMKILIAYDGSSGAEAALDDLQRAGLPADAEAVVMSVTEVWLPAPPPSSLEIVEMARAVHVPADMTRIYALNSPAVHAAEAHADRAASRLRTNFPAWQITTETDIGS